MSIEVAYEFPHTPWNVAKVYHKVAKELEKTNSDVVLIDSPRRGPVDRCHFYSPHYLTITNKDTGKYIAVSYWDRCHEMFQSDCGWDTNKLKAIYTSAGVTELAYSLSKEHNIPIIPISYCGYHHFIDDMSDNSIPANQKPNKNLFFRGWLYGIRNDLSKILPDNIIGTQDNGKRLDPKSYYEELTQHSINLSLNGSAEICHRDIEILSTRSALIRPILNQKFKNELIEGVHYLGFEPSDDPEKMAKDIISLYEKLKNNSKLLEEVSENGYKWYLENGSIQKNADIILEQLNLELIK